MNTDSQSEDRYAENRQKCFLRYCRLLGLKTGTLIIGFAGFLLALITAVIHYGQIPSTDVKVKLSNEIFHWSVYVNGLFSLFVIYGVYKEACCGILLWIVTTAFTLIIFTLHFLYLSLVHIIFPAALFFGGAGWVAWFYVLNYYFQIRKQQSNSVTTLELDLPPTYEEALKLPLYKSPV